MKIVREDLWKPCDFWIVTTNSTLRSDLSLVMGRGSALEATKRWPGIDRECGKAIADHFARNVVYGFLVVRPNFGIFQVKKFWGDMAELGIIKISVEFLANYAGAYAGMEFRMNFPGIGNGRLKYEEVLPLLEKLPDNVIICTK